MPYIGRGSDFGVRSRFIYTATAGQTTFSGNDDAGITLAYTDTLYMDVYQNGVLLVPATDYAASTGTSVVLEQGASVGDTVELLVHDIFSVADAVSAKDGGTFSGTIAAAGLSTSSLGTSNFRAGVNAGNSITAGGNYNVTVGDEAGTAITTGDANTFVGFEAGKTVSTASENTAFGYQALKLNAAGDGNTAIGVKAMDANVIGDRNVAVGADALGAMNPDSNADMYNTAVGYSAGKATTTGTNNTFVGGLAGDSIQDGSNNIIIGYASDAGNSVSNAIVLGVGIASAANDFSFGKASNEVFNDFDTDAAWTRSSDERLKTNIVETTLGLDFVNDLRPVKYKWKANGDLDPNDPQLAHLRKLDENGDVINDMTTDVVMHNFIAQEVKAALDKAGVSDFGGWKENKHGVQQVSREMFILPLVKAVQELSVKNDALEARLAALEAK